MRFSTKAFIASCESFVKAVTDCDLIISIGARWDDRITGKVDEFCPKATKIHIDVDPAEFNKVLRPDLCLPPALFRPFARL